MHDSTHSFEGNDKFKRATILPVVVICAWTALELTTARMTTDHHMFLPGQTISSEIGPCFPPIGLNWFLGVGVLIPD